MQEVLVAVSKNGLSEQELKSLRALDGKEYDQLKQFYSDLDLSTHAPSANIRVIFGYASDWAKFLSNAPFDNSAFIYITIKVEGNLR